MNQHKLVVIMGSPHLSGNGACSVDTIIESAAAEDTVCKKYELCRLNIKNCIGCRKCIENGGNCVLKDDMAEIFEEIKTADTVLISSPIYICQVNGYTKTFLDRLYPLTDEQHKPRFGKRKLVMLYTYGAPVPFLFRAYMKRTGKDLKAMGLSLKKTIVLHGCGNSDKIKNSPKQLAELKLLGKKICKM